MGAYRLKGWEINEQKNILLCVTGGIAVYKAVALVSKLAQAGMNVKVIMTASARQFVNPLSFQVMSKNDVFLIHLMKRIRVLLPILIWLIGLTLCLSRLQQPMLLES